METSSSRFGEKATYYSAVCLETGEVEACFDKAAKVHEKVDAFFIGLADCAEEVKQRCRRELQAFADALVAKTAEPVT